MCWEVTALTIETVRLTLIPLAARQLTLWLDDMTALEEELNCRYRAEPLEGPFLAIVKGQLPIVLRDEGHYLYHTFWLLVRKTDRVVVGSAAFKDVPNADGAVEIGYGLGKAFERRGYMTEAVRAMCRWGLSQPDVKYVIAETERGNLVSQRVLERCSFVLYKEDDTLWWRIAADGAAPMLHGVDDRLTR